jgi:hypothetical protein
MTQVLLPFISAILLSSVAAFYSVIGLAQIFPGSFWPIVVMGSILEISKLVTVSWLYNQWEKTVFIMRVYFIGAILLVMLITSMGIFGFLSKAHLETDIVVGTSKIGLNILEQKEEIAIKRLNFLIMKAGTDPDKISRRTHDQITEVQEQLIDLAEQKRPLLQEQNALLSEVGPIKYIAQALFDEEDPHFIDKAVRVVIVIIIIVFDPLAILLLIASNQTYRNMLQEQKIKVKQKPKPKPKPKRKKKAIKRKKVDLPPSPSLESYFVDDKHELVEKNNIAEIDGEDDEFTKQTKKE